MIVVAVGLPYDVAAGDLKWSAVNIPAEGPAGKWTLAAGSDIRCLTQTTDGTLYCTANPTSTSYRLFKSADRGLSWAAVGKVADDIVDIAVAEDDPNTLYYATLSVIYMSHDTARTFKLLARSPGGAGADGLEITSIAVTLFDGQDLIAAAVRDTDASQFGGIYTWTENLSPEWTDTALTGCDVYEVAFSPDYASDTRITAVATNETDTLVTTSLWGEGWGSSVGDARLSSVTPASAQIAFSEDFSAGAGSGRHTQYMALNTGSGAGDVYRLTSKAAPTASQLTDLNVGEVDGLANMDVKGLAVFGSPGIILAGAADRAEVYFSSDSGETWTAGLKPPTGASNTQVLFDKAFAESELFYAATSGIESAISVSRDWGQTWNQISLIDTVMTNIQDLALSAEYAQDSTLFLLTADVENSLWRSTDGGSHWERIFSSVLPEVDRLNLVKTGLSGELYLAGTGSGRACLWLSNDNGQTFNRMNSRDPATGTPLEIDAWEITPDGTLMAAGFDGAHGVLCSLNKTNLRYEKEMEVGSQQINSLVFSPDYLQDGGILVGGKAGGVYYSTAGGDFYFLPSNTAIPPLSGAVTVAFDPDFKSNQTVYAADETADAGIYRFIIGKSTAWEAIDDTLPSGSQIDQLSLSSSGVLSASNHQAVDAADTKGGIERSLNPDFSSGATFETVNKGLEDGAVLKKLWISGQTLWSIDSVNSRLMTYTDLLPVPVEPVSPSDKTNGLDTHHITLDWQALDGADTYRWQIDTDRAFEAIPAEHEGTVESTSVILPDLEPDTTYYWRVKAEKPVVSPWSDKWTFSTVLTRLTVGPELSSPAADKAVSIQPLFQWSSFAGAEGYELLVARDQAFADIEVDKSGADACLSNAWKCDIKLDHDTAYYWKVRAVSAANRGDWSPVGIFMTEVAPAAAAPAPATVLSSPPPSTVVVASSGSAPTQLVVPVITITSVSPETDSLESTLRWLFLLVGGLIVLTIVLIVAVIYIFKKLRKL